MNNTLKKLGKYVTALALGASVQACTVNTYSNGAVPENTPTNENSAPEEKKKPLLSINITQRPTSEDEYYHHPRVHYFNQHRRVHSPYSRVFNGVVPYHNSHSPWIHRHYSTGPRCLNQEFHYHSHHHTHNHDTHVERPYHGYHGDRYYQGGIVGVVVGALIYNKAHKHH